MSRPYGRHPEAFGCLHGRGGASHAQLAIPQKDHSMSKRENEANVFRPSDRPLTEYEEEQRALHKNLERLRTERLAREKAKSEDRTGSN
jgi:hypothetical protein